MAAFSFNFFFLPPFYTLTIAEPQNWIALIAFLIVAGTVGQLSANAKYRAELAEDLYDKLQAAFEQASEAEALKKSEKLKSSLLDAVTHDLRTPLTSIKASVTTLLDSEGGHRTIELDAEGRREFLDVINEENGQVK
jgi:two-component system sensor histidine kinase KdpD